MVSCRARHELTRRCNATAPTLFYAYGTSRARPMWAWLCSASTALQWRNYACTLSIWVRATLLCRWPACARHLEPGAGTARATLRRWRKVSKPGRARTGNTPCTRSTLDHGSGQHVCHEPTVQEAPFRPHGDGSQTMLENRCHFTLQRISGPGCAAASQVTGHGASTGRCVGG